jgi:hypothetical protein
MSQFNGFALVDVDGDIFAQYDAIVASRPYLLEDEEVDGALGDFDRLVASRPYLQDAPVEGIPDGTPFAIGYGRGRGCRIVLG